MHGLIVQFALEGPVKLLIGGNRYDHYGINYAIAAASPHYEYVLDKHIFLSRAETCYQMVELLLETRIDPIPIMVLDLLKTFYDESAHDQEVNQLFFESILALRRFRQEAPVVVSANPEQNRSWMMKALEKAADQVEYLAPEPPQPSQQRSFIQ